MAHHHQHQHQHCHVFPVVEQQQQQPSQSPASSQQAASGSTQLQQQQPGFHHIPPPFAAPGLLHHHQGFVPYTFQLSAAAAAAAAAAASAPVSSALVEELIKLSPPGSPPPPPESGRYGIVAMLEHKTEQLQSLVHSMSQACHHNGGVIQPQAAMAIARIASNIYQLAIALGVVPAPPPGPAFFLSEPAGPAAAPHHISIGMGSALGLFHQLNGGCIPPPPPPPPAPARNAVVPHDEQEAPAPASPPSPSAAAAADQEDAVPDSQEAPPPVALDEGGGDGSREEEDEGEAEELTPGSYDLVEMNAMEILAEHTHFCDKCGKGFKRDANLRMHMRGHGEQYKSPAALARPAAQGDGSGGSGSNETRPRRYSCPYVGCKRNKKHRKFQPLKTVLCVKNHYRRSHCPKSLTCAKCKSKKFSVVADLKTHEKHCGRDKWQCSCGTTFSRKDKLLGHITLFQGHTPAIPLDQQPPATSSSSSVTSGAAAAAAAVAAAAADLTAFAQQQPQQH